MSLRKAAFQNLPGNSERQEEMKTWRKRSPLKLRDPKAVLSLMTPSSPRLGLPDPQLWEEVPPLKMPSVITASLAKQLTWQEQCSPKGVNECGKPAFQGPRYSTQACWVHTQGHHRHVTWVAQLHHTEATHWRAPAQWLLSLEKELISLVETIHLVVVF